MLALPLVSVGSAYELAEYAWPAERLPVELRWTGAQDGLTAAEVQAALEGAASAWTQAGVCSFGFVVVEDPDAADAFEAGGVAVLFGDPEDVLEEGVLTATLQGAGGGARFTSNGRTVDEAPPFEIVVNQGGAWATDAAIAAGDCEGRVSLQSVLTHELGHVLGLADACERGGACGDEDAPDATMAWSMATCDAGASTLGTDDVDGLEAIYGGCGDDGGADDTGEADGGETDSGVPDPGVDTGDRGPAEEGGTGCGGCATRGAGGSFLAAAWAALAAGRRRWGHVRGG